MSVVRGNQTRRGSAYVLILVVISLVGMIGMSALMAVRVQHRGVELRVESTKAQQIADAALQIVHARLSGDVDWRSSLTHDVWSSFEALADGGFEYKLVDEQDADLSDESQDQVRLYARATCGDAVRISSVMLMGVDSLGPNLVVNGDMELGSSGYNTGIFILSQIKSFRDGPHGGEMYLALTQRVISLAGLYRDMTGLIEAGQTYRVSAWLQMDDSATTANLGISYVSGLIPGWVEVEATVGTGWTYVSGDLTPSWSGSNAIVDFYYSTDSTLQDIYIDDLSVRQVYAAQPLPVVRGSYRREVQ